MSSPLSDLERFAFESADLRKTLEAVFPEFQIKVERFRVKFGRFLVTFEGQGESGRSEKRNGRSDEKVDDSKRQKSGGQLFYF